MPAGLTSVTMAPLFRLNVAVTSGGGREGAADGDAVGTAAGEGVAAVVDEGEGAAVAVGEVDGAGEAAPEAGGAAEAAGVPLVDVVAAGDAGAEARGLAPVEPDGIAVSGPPL